MKNRKTRSAMRRMLFTLALVLVVAVASVGGTIAWLTATTAPVVNTFTYGNINITLAETTGTNYKIIPGVYIEKDPKVTVKGGSEDCWVFIKVAETGGNITVGEGQNAENYSFEDFIAYKIDEANWKQLTDENDKSVPGVYYCYANDVVKDRNIKILDEGKYTFDKQHVLTKPNVTKEMMNAVNDSNKPTLTFTAYASQYWKNNTENFTAYEAWKNVSGN